MIDSVPTNSLSRSVRASMIFSYAFVQLAGKIRPNCRAPERQFRHLTCIHAARRSLGMKIYPERATVIWMSTWEARRSRNVGVYLSRYGVHRGLSLIGMKMGLVKWDSYDILNQFPHPCFD